MRVKVLWKDHKFVLPTGKNSNARVSDLFKDIASKFSSYTTEEFVVSELKTIDGFIISPHYLIEEAIVDNETLVAVDFESWKNEQFKLCNKQFVLFALENFEQDNKLRVTIGLNTLNKLFVSIGLYNKLYRLELFDSSDLRAFHKNGEHAVTHWEDGSGNIANIFFIVENGVVKTVRSEISTQSSPRPQIQTIDINVIGNKIEAGEIKTIQNAYEPYSADSTVPVPDEVRVGKSYQDYDSIDYYTTDGGNGTDASSHAIVSGPSNIRFEQIDITRAEMSQYPTNNGGFMNSFYTDFQITNNDDARVTLSKIAAEYQDASGEWKSMSALFGTKRGNSNYDYNWRTDNILIPLDPRETIKLSFNTRVEIKGQNSERRYRSHASLPNVLNIKVHVTDDKQKVTTIPILYKNKTEDPVFVTLKTKQARTDLPIVYFQTVDNLETTNRGYVQLTKSKNDGRNILVYSSNFSSTQHYISEVSLHEAVYTAAKKNETKHKIEHYSANNSDFSVEVFANIDLQAKKVTSLVFELYDSSKSNSSIKYFSIPKFTGDKW